MYTIRRGSCNIQLLYILYSSETITSVSRTRIIIVIVWWHLSIHTYMYLLMWPNWQNQNVDINRAIEDEEATKHLRMHMIVRIITKWIWDYDSCTCAYSWYWEIHHCCAGDCTTLNNIRDTTSKNTTYTQRNMCTCIHNIV